MPPLRGNLLDDLSQSGWIQRRSKDYKLLADQYVADIRRLLKIDTERKLHDLESLSVVIKLQNQGSDEPSGSSAVTLPDLLPGVNIGPENFQGVDLNHKLCVYEGDKLLTRAKFLSRDSSAIKIKFFESVKLWDKEQAKKKTEAAENEATSQKEEQERILTLKLDNSHIHHYSHCINDALQRFKRSSCSVHIHRCLLGLYNSQHEIKYERTRLIGMADRAPKLNKLQRLAIEESFKKHITLIEGPQSSGKTLVAAHIAFNMCRLKKRKVLLCSPNQETVDKLASMLMKLDNIMVLKLPIDRENLSKMDATKHRPSRRYSFRSTRNINMSDLFEDTDSDLIHVPLYQPDWSSADLDELVNSSIYMMARQRAVNLFGRDIKYLHSYAQKVVSTCSPWLRRRFERKIVGKADVVCATLTQAASYLLEGISFNMLIIDDVQSAPEMDCLIPLMVKGIDQVALLSEDVKCSANSTPETEQSPSKSTQSLRGQNPKCPSFEYAIIDPTDLPGGLFKRWLLMGIPAISLQNQYGTQPQSDNSVV